MKALVAGATGPVGQAVVHRLLAEGHEVAIVTRRPFLAERLFSDTIAIHEWHPIGEPLPRSAAGDCDAILCLMGSPLTGGRARGREALATASRVTALRRIAEATAARDVRLVVTSLAGTTPPSGATETDETAVPDASQTQPRGCAWEAEAEALRRASWNIAIVRLGLVAAETEIIGELTRLARKGIVPRLKGALIPAIAPEDAAAMLVTLLEQRDVVGLVHGVAPTPVRGEAVMAALRARSPFPVPFAVPLRLLRRRLGLATALFECRRQIVPEPQIHGATDFAVGDPTERLAQAITGQHPSHTRIRPPPEPPVAPVRLMPDATSPAAVDPIAVTRQP